MCHNNEIIPGLKKYVEKLSAIHGREKVESWLTSISKYGKEDQEEVLSRLSHNDSDLIYCEELLNRLSMFPIISNMSYFLSGMNHVKGVRFADKKIVKTILIGCPDSVCKKLEDQSIDFFKIKYNRNLENAKQYLQGCDAVLIIEDICNDIQAFNAIGIAGLCRIELGIKPVYITSQSEPFPRLPYKDYNTSFGEHIDMLRSNCTVLAVDLINDSSWDVVSDTAIQTYRMLSKKNVVEKYSDSIDVEVLSKLLSVQYRHEGNLIISNKSGFASGEDCGQKAANEAIEKITSMITMNKVQLPDWAIVQIKHNIGNKINLNTHWKKIDCEWMGSLKNIREKLNPNATIYTQIQLNENESQEEQSIEVSIIAPSRCNGLAKLSKPLYKTLMDLDEKIEKLEKSEKALKAEKAQTEELMQWIAHSTNSDLTSLELSVKREHAVNSQVLTQRIRQDVETFSLMSSDSDAFVNAVKQDIVGTKSLYDVICESVISTMLFMLSPKARDQNLINHRYFNYAQRQGLSQDVKQEDWVESSSLIALQKEMFTNFLSLKDDNVAALSWISEHFGNIAITIDDAIHLQMSEHGKKAAVLGYIFKQFTSNAMKYGVADANEDMLSIQCNINSDSYALTCFNQALPRHIQMGNNKGLKAMDVMLSKLRQHELAIQEESYNYRVSCCLSTDLMGG